MFTRALISMVFLASLPLILLAVSAQAVRAADPAGDLLDAAPFARVCTWDPQRTVGIRANRLEEIAAEDLFLETDLFADPDGCWQVPPAANSQACIGLQWLEGRPLRSLGISFGSDLPASQVGQPVIQFWEGATLWQGKWVAVDGKLEAKDKAWTFTLAQPGRLYWKARWIIPAGGKPVKVSGLSALTASPMTSSKILVQCDPARPNRKADLVMYNGQIVLNDKPVLQTWWDMGSALELTVRHASLDATRQVRADRTSIRFRMPDGAFAVAIDDVLERGPVYVAHAGLFVSKVPPGKSLEEYKREVQSKKTVLEQVREMPDQTREQAMSRTHYNPALDGGRMMISLACDNAKFVTEANGTIFYYDNFDRDAKGRTTNYAFTPLFGNRRILGQSQTWGTLGLNKAAHADPASALALQIHDKKYSRGIGHHSMGEIVIDVSEGFERFEAEVGLQWQGGGTPGSVVFQVLVDGKQQFDSGVMKENDDPKPVNVPLADAKTLSLRLTDAGDGRGFDAGDWCEARLIAKGPDAKPVYLTELFTAAPKLSRHLEGGWLPAPVVTTTADGVEYRQRTYVVPFEKENLPTAPLWLNAKPLCMVELTLKNTKAEPADVGASFVFSMGGAEARAPSIETVSNRTIVTDKGQLVGVFDCGEFAGSKVRSGKGHVSLSGQLPAAGSARCYLYLPAWKMTPDQQAELSGGPELFDRFKAYWEAILVKGMQIDLPDPWIADVIKANLVHVMLAARNEQQGKLIVPWIASDRYWVAIDSEGNSPIRGVQYWGQNDFARRSFEYFFTHYKPQGFMTMGYTVMGSGWHLWALGEYMQLARDDDWFKSVVGKPAGLCQWVMAQLAKTRKLRSDSRKLPQYGLMPPGVQADWNAYAYYFYANSYFRAGLAATGQALKAIGHPDADKVLAGAEELRGEILRSFKEAQALAPVVPLANGTWVPYYPASAYTPGLMADYYPGQDGNRSWCYDVDLGSHHMIALGAMKPDAPDVDWIMNHMEDVQFLSEGWGGYPAVRNHAEWFDMGGFAKVQPYYCRNAEICALRDDVKPFVRSYFNTLASLVDGTCLSIFEHFSNFCYNKTHETGYFLYQSRTMLVTERGEELWLAPFVTSNWFKDEMHIAVKSAPTRFGVVSYRIDSNASRGRIGATIEPPTRSAPKAIVLRLRHPEGKPMKTATVDGRPPIEFDPKKETIRFAPTGKTIRVEAHY
jgi:hypothetical protein